jgi:hypothetical protein
MNKSNCFPICDVQEIKCKSESVINKKLNMDANGYCYDSNWNYIGKGHLSGNAITVDHGEPEPINRPVSQAYLKAKRMINNACPIHYKGVLNFVLLFLRKCKSDYERNEIIKLYRDKISQY